MIAQTARLALLLSSLTLAACSSSNGSHDGTWSASGSGSGSSGSSSGGGHGGSGSGGASSSGSGSSGGSGGSSGGPTGCADVFEVHNLDVINKYRAGAGLAPMVLDAQICAFAQAGSQEETQDHAPHQHIINAMNDGTIWNYGFYTMAAENQGDPNGWPKIANDATDNEMQQIDAMLGAMYAEGPGAGEAHSHYTNIMDSRLKRVGVGLLEVNSQLYLTNDFSD